MSANYAGQSTQPAEKAGQPASLSLTPCFSGVLRETRGIVNRFNGFPVPSSYLDQETVKTVGHVSSPANTPLKQGVKENEGVVYKSSTRRIKDLRNVLGQHCPGIAAIG
jgi:hypothetical protein